MSELKFAALIVVGYIFTVIVAAIIVASVACVWY